MTLLQPWVRDDQSGLVHDLVAVEQQVEVDRARPEALAADPSHSLLDAEQAAEQLPGRELRLESDRAVQERALLDRADGLGFPDLRNGANLNAILGRKKLDRPC